MTATRVDLEIWIGSDFSQDFELLQDNDSIFDLSGSEIVFRAVDGKGTELFRLTSVSDSEIEITDASAGEFTLSLSSSQTRLIPQGRVAQYELERRLAGTQEPLLSGFFIAEGGINDD